MMDLNCLRDKHNWFYQRVWKIPQQYGKYNIEFMTEVAVNSFLKNVDILKNKQQLASAKV